MKGPIGLLLFTLGVGLAAASGARNGEAHTAWRRAVAVDAPDAAQLLPAPRDRLRGWFATGGAGWVAGLLLIVGGAALSRQQQREADAPSADGSTARADFEASVTQIRQALVPVREALATLPMDADSTALREQLDAIRDDLIGPLVDARGQLVSQHGLSGFAEYFGTFSGAERNLNRCWSALTDGHSRVAREALELADQAFATALDQHRAVANRG